MVENIGFSMIDMINMSCGCYKLHHACKRITLITKQTCVYRPCKTYHLSLKRGFLLSHVVCQVCFVGILPVVIVPRNDKQIYLAPRVIF